MPRKTPENPEALLHTHKERIGWPRLGGVCSNAQTAWQEEKQMQIRTIRVVKKNKKKHAAKVKSYWQNS